MNKIAIAITGASGAIYAKLLIEKLLVIKDQWNSLGIVMSNNAKEVWKTELENEDYKNYPLNFSTVTLFINILRYNFISLFILIKNL